MHIGLDIGTSAIKALLLDSALEPIASATSALSVLRPQPAWSEQNPQDWLDAVDKLMTQFKDTHPEKMAHINSIGLSGQMHGLVALDAKDHVLRPAILWNDVRNAIEAAELDLQQPLFREIGGNAVMPGFTAPKALWMARHEASLFKKIKTILLPKDYVRLWLSGEKISDMSDCSGTLWLDIAQRDYCDELLYACGLNRLQMPALAEGSAPAGTLRTELATKWGINTRPVLAGAGDNAAAACGLGIVAPNHGFISLGTSGVVFAVTEQFAPAPQKGVHAFCHALPDLWHQMGVILSATDSLNWLSEVTSKPVDILASLAAKIETPKSNILFHPYLSGERTPHNDARAKGGFFGISRSDGLEQMAFAVLEGVAFALADCVDALRSAGTAPNLFLATGGGAKNTQWLQMIADMTGVQIAQPVTGDFGAALGAARLGAIATGLNPQQVLTQPSIGQKFSPNPNLSDYYKQRHAKWQQLYYATHNPIPED